MAIIKAAAAYLHCIRCISASPSVVMHMKRCIQQQLLWAVLLQHLCVSRVLPWYVGNLYRVPLRSGLAMAEKCKSIGIGYLETRGKNLHLSGMEGESPLPVISLTQGTDIDRLKRMFCFSLKENQGWKYMVVIGSSSMEDIFFHQRTRETD